MAKKRLLVIATHQGIEKAKKVLLREGLGTKTNFANARRLSRTTVTKFFNRKPIQLDSFQRICEELKLPWKEIIDCSENAELELGREEQNASSSQSSISDIDALVQEMRQRIKPDIQERCGTMRVLDMTQPITLNDIYTSVNILEKITGRRGLERSELMQDVSPEIFERYCLGDIRERRIPGLEAVKKFSKLMILGKPGAGKTTFLKHLAIRCIGSGFQSEYLPLFITLKDFAEAKDKPDLLKYITVLVSHNLAEIPPTPLNKGGYKEGLLPPFNKEKGGYEKGLLPPLLRGARGDLQPILSAGRALILLDGLDEVREADSSRVLQQIREFLQHFSQNQFIITCRIAALEYTFETFTEVEIADFNNEQIADFSGKWFRSKNDPIKAELFLERLEEDESICELATNPLLLTLLCLVFEDSGSFPTNRSELYKTGVDVFLKKWDVKRNIEREQVYKRLSLKRKEDLLSQIARITFESGNYFFKQREVERYITKYIQNLPDANTDPEALELDSVAVLKSIEAQHGLFVERARGIYSFSHLTFHEYFTARKIVASCNPYAADDPTLQGLVSHLTEKRWREVFLLTVEMLDSADVLLRLMKERIDKLLAGDEKLQKFLKWVDEKARSVETLYKPIAVQAIYLEIGLGVIPEINLDLACAIDCRLSLGHKLDIYDPALDPSTSISIDIRLFYVLFLQSRTALNYVLEHSDNSDFKYELQELNMCFPVQKVNSKFWTDKLRQVMIKYRNFGHDWQFNDEQKQVLQQYYDSNKLLVDCLNSDCYVSREVRQEIEETLLLPIAELEKRKQLN